LIPVYNKEEWVSDTLQSVFNQSYKNWECIIINDGSTDESLAKINEFTTNNPAVWKVVSTPNSGQTAARNYGIELSAGELVAFLDADDLWHQEKIESQVRFFNSNPDAHLVFTPYVIFRRNQIHGFRIVGGRNPKKLVRDWLNMRGFGGLIESTGMIRRKTLLEFGGFPKDFSMTAGLDLSLRIVRSRDTAITSKPHVFYRLSEGQFHKNEDVLIKDLKMTSVQHTNSRGELLKLSSLHSNYLFWSERRRDGKSSFIKSMILAFMLLDYRKISMLYFLISRNLYALIRGQIHRGYIREFLFPDSLNSPGK
jgi:glycosyltransferase involved in cell wall biosynthesis